MSLNKRMPTYFISHGGGPWPWLSGPYRDACETLYLSLKELPNELPQKPKAILMISGHWEEKIFTIMSNPRPEMVYDYYGFPDHTYSIKYPALGSTDLVKRVQELLRTAEIETNLDSSRGFDHGAFAPLAVSYPKAEVPVIQISLRYDYDPAAHLNLGRALAPLRDEGILIIGSGLSYHNLSFFDKRASVPSKEFDTWLHGAIIESSPNERNKKLLSWEQAPSARIAHPNEDHLIPLMVVVGASEQDSASLCYHEETFLGGIVVSSFKFSS